ncbi:MAG: hypothetical protein JJ975_00060 [Bacteroidia bacterium]|nr:hypothetical protein [Bacteroidia bacterium]
MDLPSLHIDPNPVRPGARLRIRFYNENLRRFTIEILDNTKTVVAMEHSLAQPVVLVDLPTSGLATGTYQVRIRNGQDQTSRRLTIL